MWRSPPAPMEILSSVAPPLSCSVMFAPDTATFPVNVPVVPVIAWNVEIPVTFRVPVTSAPEGLVAILTELS